MKRSEALKLIEGLFKLAPNFPAELNAENLLSHLEEIGMEPPNIKAKTGYYENCYVNEWEPEDESN